MTNISKLALTVLCSLTTVSLFAQCRPGQPCYQQGSNYDSSSYNYHNAPAYDGYESQDGSNYYDQGQYRRNPPHARYKTPGNAYQNPIHQGYSHHQENYPGYSDQPMDGSMDAHDMSNQGHYQAAPKADQGQMNRPATAPSNANQPVQSK